MGTFGKMQLRGKIWMLNLGTLRKKWPFMRTVKNEIQAHNIHLFWWNMHISPFKLEIRFYLRASKKCTKIDWVYEWHESLT